MVQTEKEKAEEVRRELLPIINSTPVEELPLPHWDAEALLNEFEVIGFAAPLVVVRKRDTGEKGSLMFKHNPRIYFGWEPHKP